MSMPTERNSFILHEQRGWLHTTCLQALRETETLFPENSDMQYRQERDPNLLGPPALEEIHIAALSPLLLTVSYLVQRKHLKSIRTADMMSDFFILM